MIYNQGWSQPVLLIEFLQLMMLADWTLFFNLLYIPFEYVLFILWFWYLSRIKLNKYWKINQIQIYKLRNIKLKRIKILRIPFLSGNALLITLACFMLFTLVWLSLNLLLSFLLILCPIYILTWFLTMLMHMCWFLKFCSYWKFIKNLNFFQSILNKNFILILNCEV